VVVRKAYQCSWRVLVDGLHAQVSGCHIEHPRNQVTPNDGRGGNDLASLREKCAQQSAQADVKACDPQKHALFASEEIWLFARIVVSGFHASNANR